MSYFLRQVVTTDSSTEPMEIYLTENEVHVGRKITIGLKKYPQISRDHAIFYKSDEGSLLVKDSNSLNGVYVNGAKIGSSLKTLKVGDLIGFGVPEDSADVGFVCVVCVDVTSYEVKEEVIDLTDDLPAPPLKQETSPVREDEDTRWSFNFGPFKELRHVESVPTRNCSLPLVQRDSEDFNLPDDVLKERKRTGRSSPDTSSEEGYFNGLRKIKCGRKRGMELNSDSSSSEEEQEKSSEGSEKVKNRKFIKLMISDSSSEEEEEEYLRETFFCSQVIEDQNGSAVCRKGDDTRELEVVSSKECSNSRKETPTVKDVSSQEDCLRKGGLNASSDYGVNSEESEAGIRNNDFDDTASRVTSYSRVDEVIYISDDESYLDFTWPQVEVKKEVEEPKDPDDQIYRAIFESDNEQTATSFIAQNQELDDSVESIEAVRAFVNNTAEENPRELVSNTRSDSTPVKSKSSQVHSQGSNGGEENSSGDESNLTCPSVISIGSIERNPEEIYAPNDRGQSVEMGPNFATNSNTKTSSKVLLIAPQPMSYRPRWLRGRDEGFVERPKPANDGLGQQRRRRRRTKKLPPENEAIDRSSTGKTTATHIQPIPNRSSRGRAAAERSESMDAASFPQKRKKGTPRKVTSENETAKPSSIEKSFKIPRKASSSAQKDAAPPRIGSDKNAPPTASGLTNAKEIKKGTPAVKTLPERFGSRIGFLISELEINPQSKTPTRRNRCDSKSDKVPAPSSSSANKVINTSKPSEVTASRNSSAAANKSAMFSQATSAEAVLHKPADPRLKSKNLTLSQKPHDTPEVSSPALLNDSGSKLPRAGGFLPFDLSFNGLIKTLIKMNTKWLQEQTALEIPPEAVTQGVVNLPLTYKSYESYASLLYPMILLEIWDYMYTESKDYKPFYFSVLSYTEKEDCIELKCESVVNEKVCFVPREGVIAIFEVKENSRMCHPLFGYIFKHKIDPDPLRLDSLKASQWKKLSDEWLKNAKRWTFSAYIRKKEMSFQLHCLMRGKGICYIRTKLRLADSLRLVRDCPLLQDILRPRTTTFFVNCPFSFPALEYTKRQMAIIRGIIAEVTKPLMEPKIILLQGPPGTGKTQAIIGLLEMLFDSSKYKSNLKILITAPSNAAVDEIGCRLIELNERSSWKDYRIKFVRVGVEKHIHPQMMPYFIDNMVKDQHQLDLQAWKRNKKELRALRAEINRLEEESPNFHRNERLEYLKEQYRLFKGQTSIKEMDYNTDMMYKTNILKESHVVLGTLSRLSLLSGTFGQNSVPNFSFCIVDESTQCTEVEILQPLMFGVSKLVLVGDPKQLPATVYSKFAVKHGLQRSMFERFQAHFESLGKRSPALVLNEQFRMDASICAFPSRYIYGGQLITHPDTTLRYKKFPLFPYIVLDVSGDGLDSNNALPQDEATIILSLCQFLVGTVVDSASLIGVIASYQAQRSLYVKALYPHYKETEVNTVDTFQNKEKDIIILSSLGASSHPEGANFLNNRRRLNVALTRAKKCLIVCVQSASLDSYPEWKALIRDARQRKLCFSVTCLEDIYRILRSCRKRK